jgi:hypothetical protein
MLPAGIVISPVPPSGTSTGVPRVRTKAMLPVALSIVGINRRAIMKFIQEEIHDRKLGHQQVRSR